MVHYVANFVMWFLCCLSRSSLHDITLWMCKPLRCLCGLNFLVITISVCLFCVLEPKHISQNNNIHVWMRCEVVESQWLTLLCYRESSSISICKYLLEEGASITIYDPKVEDSQIYRCSWFNISSLNGLTCFFLVFENKIIIRNCGNSLFYCSLVLWYKRCHVAPVAPLGRVTRLR